MTQKTSLLKSFLVVALGVVAGWGMTLLIGYGLLRGLLTSMSSDDE